MGEQLVNVGNSYIRYACDFVIYEFIGDGRFFGDVVVGGSGGDYCYDFYVVGLYWCSSEDY